MSRTPRHETLTVCWHSCDPNRAAPTTPRGLRARAVEEEQMAPTS
jgi:hypothetical protein